MRNIILYYAALFTVVGLGMYLLIFSEYQTLNFIGGLMCFFYFFIFFAPPKETSKESKQDASV